MMAGSNPTSPWSPPKTKGSQQWKPILIIQTLVSCLMDCLAWVELASTQESGWWPIRHCRYNQFRCIYSPQARATLIR
ncbi:uncharacterized protein B0J16DRAFT_343329 [Fusarium flagelliforme]|uniref:uncharacterized protein n=1 Tax=Fusarium flagelliforme TaxID=2675880 RepID=UPI001E8CE1AD|nr:uncharacterized protein B0J16DRAFT_343329 [Fusarium flagelliforme]KAH7186183.1 hypothetical protein B0J16DRAFT_343329 [Fusarium flagelliforme]